MTPVIFLLFYFLNFIFMVQLKDLKNGDLLVWEKALDTTKFNYLKLVRLATYSNFGHVTVVWKKPGGLFQVDASKPVISLEKVKNFPGLFVIPTGSFVSDEEMKSFFDDKIGLEYGTMDAIRAWLGLVLADENKWQCAELCLWFFRSLGFELSDAYTPKELVYELMTKYNMPLYKVLD